MQGAIGRCRIAARDLVGTDALDVVGLRLAELGRQCLTSACALFGPVVTLEEPLTCWRQRSGSISRGANQRDPLSANIRRNRCFNHVAARYGFSSIHLWLNRRFYRQLVRRLLPRAVGARLARNPEGRRDVASSP